MPPARAGAQLAPQLGKTENAGISDSGDAFPCLPSTLERELAADGLVARPFAPGDTAEVRTLFKEGMSTYARDLPKGSPLNVFFNDYIESALRHGDMASAESITATYEGSGGRFWVVRDNDGRGRVVGQVGLQRLAGGEGELRRMSVRPGLRQRGLGSKLVRLVEEHGAAIGLSQLVLTTGSVMGPAVALYERCGWEACRFGHPTGEFRRELDAAGQSLCEVAFRKPVTSANGRWMWRAHDGAPSAVAFAQSSKL